MSTYYLPVTGAEAWGVGFVSIVLKNDRTLKSSAGSPARLLLTPPKRPFLPVHGVSFPGPTPRAGVEGGMFEI